MIFFLTTTTTINKKKLTKRQGKQEGATCITLKKAKRGNGNLELLNVEALRRVQGISSAYNL